MTSTKIDRLQEKIDFLSQKNEALTLEVSHLLDQNSKLQNDLELSNKTTESLKNQLSTLSTSNTESTLNLKALCVNNNAHGTFSFNPKDEDTTFQEFNTDLIPSHLKDHYDEAGKESMVRNALRYSLQERKTAVIAIIFQAQHLLRVLRLPLTILKRRLKEDHTSFRSHQKPKNYCILYWKVQKSSLI